MSRPSDYTQELADELCVRLIEGQSLRAICTADDMPGKTTVFRWLETNEAFRDQYARAREMQADTLADDILHIADTPLLGERTETKGDDVKVITGDMIEHRRLQVESRKWIAAKLKPKKYGDKTTTQLTGEDGGPVIFTSWPLPKTDLDQ